MNRFFKFGGMFTYASEALGADFGFTSTWFLVLTYLAIFWANATSLPLFTKYLFGHLLRFGINYTIFGYKMYLNEAFLSVFAILLTGFCCIHIRKLLAKVNIALVLFFTFAITLIFTLCFLQKKPQFDFSPAFASESISLKNIFRVALVSPWAFIGFENISNATKDFAFSRKKSYPILRASVLTTTALYIFVIFTKPLVWC